MEIIRWLEEADAQSLAFSDENSSITYGDFRASAKRIGSALIAHFNVTKKPIVVFVDRNVQSICALFGVIYHKNYLACVSSYAFLTAAIISSASAKGSAAFAIAEEQPEADDPAFIML